LLIIGELAFKKPFKLGLWNQEVSVRLLRVMARGGPGGGVFHDELRLE
jgi:hypothetical protein